MIKRLVISASSDYSNERKLVPVNTNEPVILNSELGEVKLRVFIRNFDGANPHLSNSLYNVGDAAYLNAEPKKQGEQDERDQHNLRLAIDFKPKKDIKGNKLLFGNDFGVPIRDYVPSMLLSTGLKLFTKFINSTLRGDIYCDKPFLYGLVANSITYVTLNNTDKNGKEWPLPPANYGGKYGGGDYEENLVENGDKDIKIPVGAGPRKGFFTNLKNCEHLTFRANQSYRFIFDTISVKVADSKYAICIPTIAGRTYDIDVSKYANDKLNNFNWVLKSDGYEGVGHGTTAMVLNFALVEEKLKD